MEGKEGRCRREYRRGGKVKVGCGRRWREVEARMSQEGEGLG